MRTDSIIRDLVYIKASHLVFYIFSPSAGGFRTPTGVSKDIMTMPHGFLWLLKIVYP